MTNTKKENFFKIIITTSNIYITTYIMFLILIFILDGNFSKSYFISKENFREITTIALSIMLTYAANFIKLKEFLTKFIIYIVSILCVGFIFFDPFYFPYNRTSLNKETIIFLVPLILISIVRIVRKNNIKNQKVMTELYPSRIMDLQNLKKALENENIVGLDGEWGIGKTFLIQKFKEEKENDFIIVSLLSINTEEFISFVLNQINKILKKKGIYSFYIKKIKNVIGSQSTSFFNFAEFFSSNETYQETIEEYKKIVSELENQIIIVIDDLDRVRDGEKIEKILNFSLDFAHEKIKFIYLYSQEELKKLENNSFSRNFMEKFIPVYINISKLNFTTLFEKIIREAEYKSLNKNEFVFLLRAFKGDFFGP